MNHGIIWMRNDLYVWSVEGQGRDIEKRDKQRKTWCLSESRLHLQLLLPFCLLKRSVFCAFVFKGNSSLWVVGWLVVVFVLNFKQDRLQDYQGSQWRICLIFSEENSKLRTTIMRSLFYLNYIPDCNLLIDTSLQLVRLFLSMQVIKACKIHPWFFPENVSSKTIANCNQ